MGFMLFLQEHRTPFFNGLFESITISAEDYILIAVMCIILWCIDKHKGYKLGFAIILSSTIGAALKMTFKVERPWVKNDKIVPLRQSTATGYSFPSGHTIAGSTMWFSLSRNFKSKVLQIIAYLMMVLIAFSRVYLGVHTPADVITSLLLCIPITLFAHFAVTKAQDDGNYIYLIVSYALFLVGMFAIKSEGYYKIVGLLLAFMPCHYIESKYVRYNTKAPFIKQLLKVVIGFVIVLGIKEGLSIIFPEKIIFDFIRYFLVGVGGMLLAPWLFVKLKLSTQSSK